MFYKVFIENEANEALMERLRAQFMLALHSPKKRNVSDSYRSPQLKLASAENNSDEGSVDPRDRGTIEESAEFERSSEDSE